MKTLSLSVTLSYTHPQPVKGEEMGEIFDHKCAQPRRAVKDEKEKGVGGKWGEQRPMECEKAGEEGIREKGRWKIEGKLRRAGIN